MPSLIVYVHVYKGIKGHLLAKEYISVFMSLIKSFSGDVSINWICYGFDVSNEHTLKDFFSELDANKLVTTVKFKPSVASEVPTLREMVNYSKDIDSSSLMLYLHSKGASYQNQDFFCNWSIYSVCALAAVVDFVCSRTDCFDEFDAFGSFAGAGVFERYGKMTLAFSGNFWLTTAGFLSRQQVSDAWYSDLHHNRHYAESLIGLNTTSGRLFNLEDNYNYYSLKRHDENNIYDRKMNEIQKYFEFDNELRASVKLYIDSFYESVSRQQATYSKSRMFWSLRRWLLGNNSELRRSKTVSKILDRIFPYCNCELYRHQNGPTHYDVATKLSKER